MKKLILTALMIPAAVAFANDNAVTASADSSGPTVNTPIPAGATVIMRQPLGSGTPGYINFEPATHLGQGIYHAPQYLPGNPTAATIHPRVVEVECEKQAAGAYQCNGYNWLPAMGRGEYLYIRPYVKAPAPQPQVIIKEVAKKKIAE
jgi:hypothetical protein